jgi:hypothetical protein
LNGLAAVIGMNSTLPNLVSQLRNGTGKNATRGIKKDGGWYILNRAGESKMEIPETITPAKLFDGVLTT